MSRNPVLLRASALLALVAASLLVACGGGPTTRTANLGGPDFPPSNTTGDVEASASTDGSAAFTNAGSLIDPDGGHGNASADGNTGRPDGLMSGLWTGVETQTVACADGGSTTNFISVSWSLRPTTTGFIVIDQNGCSWTFLFTLSGDAATLASAPEMCSVTTEAGVELLSILSATIQTAAVHHLSVQFTSTETRRALVCSIEGSLELAQ